MCLRIPTRLLSVSGQYLDGIPSSKLTNPDISVGHLIADIHASVMPYTPSIIVYSPEGQPGPNLPEGAVDDFVERSSIRQHDSAPTRRDGSRYGNQA